MYKLPELPYSYDSLEPHIDAKTMEIHHSKHHAAYIKNLNAALEDHKELQDKEITGILTDIAIVQEDRRNRSRSYRWIAGRVHGQGRRGHHAGPRVTVRRIIRKVTLCELDDDTRRIPQST